METKSFIAACKEFFGFLPGQGLMQFRDEVAKLTPKDRADMVRYFKAIGWNVSE